MTATRARQRRVTRAPLGGTLRCSGRRRVMNAMQAHRLAQWALMSALHASRECMAATRMPRRHVNRAPPDVTLEWSGLRRVTGHATQAHTQQAAIGGRRRDWWPVDLSSGVPAGHMSTEMSGIADLTREEDTSHRQVLTRRLTTTCFSTCQQLVALVGQAPCLSSSSIRLA